MFGNHIVGFPTRRLIWQQKHMKHDFCTVLIPYSRSKNPRHIAYAFLNAIISVKNIKNSISPRRRKLEVLIKSHVISTYNLLMFPMQYKVSFSAVKLLMFH